MTWLARINAFIDLQETKNQQAAATAMATANGFAAWMLSLAALALVAGAVIAVLLTRSITRPLNRAVNAADALAAGDLTVRIESDSKDETGMLLASLTAPKT